MSSLVPVVVRTFGRTGSTLLMQILATDRRVVFERQYPFEHRYLTYAYNLSRMVKAPSTKEVAWGNDKLFQCQTPYIGGMPYPQIECFDREVLAEKLLPAIWAQFSLAMREKQGFSRDEPCFYAEKAPHMIGDLAVRTLGARTIHLLRDPRDELVSIKSFNTKRGFHSFGYLESDDDMSYARKMIKRRKIFMRDMLDTKEGEQRFYLRYEDLVSKGEQETSRLSDWLGVEFSLANATSDNSIQHMHMTSNTLSASVERWRKELDPGVQSLFRREIGTELDSLGYEL